ncbi:DUF6054 family protein [Nocardioides sp.]|uniref:DUF6054 family protein n=1 Tax=Nocardioides sp. TaxID=35761 RepID=UPI00356431C9
MYTQSVRGDGDLSVLEVGDELAVTAMSSGGSQAMLFKINRFGEGAFLTKAVDAITTYGLR